MQRSTIVIVVAIILVAFLLYRTRKATPAVAGGKKWTVYGTMGCGWTRKQLEHMKKAGKAHTFVDCDKEGCEGMKAFPTLVSPEGEKSVGYKEV